MIMNNFNLLINFIKASGAESVSAQAYWDLGWEIDDLNVSISTPKKNVDLTIPHFENFVEKISDSFLESTFVRDIIYNNSISDFEYPRGSVSLEIFPDEKILFSFNEDYVTEEEQEFNKEIDNLEFYNALHELNINGISATYHGYGDSGYIENFEPNFSGINSKSFDYIEEEFYHFLNNLYPGWEIDDGSRGEISVEQADEKSKIDVTITHTWYNPTNDYSIRDLDVTEEFLKYIDL